MSAALRPRAASPGAATSLALPRAACRALAACAGGASLCADVPLHDPLAEQVFGYLGGSMEQFEVGELRGAAFRTYVIDRVVSDYFGRTPNGLGVGVWSLLGTRAHRLARRWIDVDPPAIAALRRHLFPSRSHWLQLASCLCTPSWIDAVQGASGGKPLFVLDESALPLGAATMMSLLDGLSCRAAAGSEVLLAFDSATPLRPSLPLRRASATELLLRGAGPEPSIARYPRLHWVDEEACPEQLRLLLGGVRTLACLRRGVATPALAYLRVV